MNKAEWEAKIESDIIRLTAKARLSKGIFLFCSIALILSSAFNGILSAYAITKNPSETAVKLFVAIAFINAVITFVSSLSSFFVFENIYLRSTKKIEFYQAKKIALQKHDADLDKIVSDLADIKIEN
ncbi:DUF4231 domain-containing protein [Mycoplasma sp. 'Moose RK']|uniref:DUF4231 domain-containing protein n=1 Tax=Mycoplasma sp. 'Moose RK' TaxID=2780095 RepID=UPI0018C20582|nr:DUF4231 domain-containing protein [Mycoplasma sp. 'Moose RK']MBG0730888.1 DUF4231 domain-containing protein [Mycoplasma sp. 'Moose RK']